MSTIQLQLRFLVPLFVVIALTAYVTVPLVDRFSLRWFVRDLDVRSQLIAGTLADTLPEALRDNNRRRIETSFARLVQDERILGLGLCSDDGKLQYNTAAYPKSIACTTEPGTRMVELEQGPVHILAVRIGEPWESMGKLVLVHDLSFAQRRSEDTRNYLIGLFIVLGSVIALITMIIAQLSLRGWIAGAKALLRGEVLLNPLLAGKPGKQAAPELQPLVHEVRTLLRELEDEHRAREDQADQWTPERLRALLRADLRGDEVIVVSNREPYIHEKTADGIVVQRPASGLVTAVEPVMRACSGTWIAHGSGSADRDVVNSHDVVMVPPEKPAYSLKRVWLTEEDEAGYYYGFANEGLWPLCHVAHVRPVFRESDWQKYREVNQRFADAVVAAARTDDPVVLVQDYHFALLPRMVRNRLPNATIITFWHIPWLNPESFGICPWRDELLDGMLGSTILGFHTRYHCKNFIETVDRFMEARIEHEHSAITYGGRGTLVKSYPISIHWPTPEEQAAVPDTPDCRTELRQRLGLPDDCRVALGVDRFDYTKGIIERVNAVERLLENHPALIGKFALVQVAAPTRSSLEEYRIFRERLFARVDAVNERFGHAGYKPVHLLVQHHTSDVVTRYYRAADICMVTSLHDGMNLVAKEFVAARTDEQGVLILSQFAGAANELLEALIVNPYSAEETADALYRALGMPDGEQRERMRSMRGVVREYNVYRWAGRMLYDAARFRRRERIEARIHAHNGGA